MIKYTINTNNNIPFSKTIFDYETSVPIGLDGVIFFENHNLKSGDIIQFIREECNEIVFREDRVVEKIDNDSFRIDLFPYYNANIIDCKILRTGYNPSDEKQEFIEFTLANPTDIIDNSADMCGRQISELIYDDYSNYDEGKKRCPEDLILYNDAFLYQAEGVNDDNKYIFPEDNLNKKDLTLIVKGEWYNEVNNSGINWRIRDGILYLDNCIIPVDINGKNSVNTILWKGNYSHNDIIENISSSYVSYEDERFLKKEVGGTFSLKDYVSVNLYKNYFNISNVINEDFGVDLNKNDNITSELAKRIIGDDSNEIIDYEKQIFNPVYGDSNDVKSDVKSITFNLHFRKRKSDDNWDYGGWELDGNSYWNEYNTDEFKPDNADLLGYLGFTDDDVYYQKEKIKHSFLRLSFYDSIDRNNQVLLTYSTIFMNSGELYSKYVKDLNKKIDDENWHGYVFDNDVDERLCASFTCRNKYDYSSSSEGFYIYLFPNLLEMLPEKKIYLKIEFNHAKYGKKIPFVKSQENGKPKESYSEGTYIDMPALNKDMYIPVSINYDNERKIYTWEIDNAVEKDGNIVLNIYEPRVNS